MALLRALPLADGTQVPLSGIRLPLDALASSRIGRVYPILGS